MQKITPELLEKVRKYAISAEKPERYAHSLRVAETARLLAEHYGLDAEKAYFAGLSHDMCKDLDEETQFFLASHDGKPLSQEEKERPALLHGRAAAQKLQRDFGVSDADILEAVAYHTLGAKDMGALSRIIFVADKIEPGRPQSTEEYRAGLLKKSLAEMTLCVLTENMDYLQKKGKAIARQSLAFKKSLEQELLGRYDA